MTNTCLPPTNPRILPLILASSPLSPTLPMNRGARASPQATPSHLMATLPPLPLPLPHKHDTSTRIVRSFIRSFVHLFIVCSFIRSSDRSWFVRPFVRSFDRSFVRPNNLCLAVMLPKFRSFVHNPYSSFIVRS
jgi:hypothetical protein